MSRNHIDHPTQDDVYAAYGVDHVLGVFVEVFREGREQPIAVLDVFTMGAPVTVGMALDFMVGHCFFTTPELKTCTELMASGAPRPRHLIPLSYVLAFFWAELGGGPVG